MFHEELFQTQNARSHLKPLLKSNLQTPTAANDEYKPTRSNKTIIKSKMYERGPLLSSAWWPLIGLCSVYVSSHKVSIVCRILSNIFRILTKAGMAGHLLATILNRKYFIHIYSGPKGFNRLFCWDVNAPEMETCYRKLLEKARNMAELCSLEN